MTSRRISVSMTETEADQWQLGLSRLRDAELVVGLRERINAAINAAEARWLRRCSGQRHPCSKLTAGDAALIRHLHDPYRRGCGYAGLAKKFDCSTRSVRDI